MKYILVKSCGRCPANSRPLCMMDTRMDGKVRARRSRGFPKGCPLDDFPPPASITVAHSDLSGSDDSDNRVPQTGGTVCYTPQHAQPAKCPRCGMILIRFDDGLTKCVACGYVKPAQQA